MLLGEFGHARSGQDRFSVVRFGNHRWVGTGGEAALADELDSVGYGVLNSLLCLCCYHVAFENSLGRDMRPQAPADRSGVQVPASGVVGGMWDMQLDPGSRVGEKRDLELLKNSGVG